MNELGITGKIEQVWTILDMDKLFTKYNPLTGKSYKLDLQEVQPIHWNTAFLEDQLHDWTVNSGVFHFHGHSDQPGAYHNLLIITK